MQEYILGLFFIGMLLWACVCGFRVCWIIAKERTKRIKMLDSCLDEFKELK